jgi:hypothetical protein
MQNPLKFFFGGSCHNILSTVIISFSLGIIYIEETWIWIRPIFSANQNRKLFFIYVLWTCPSASDVWGSCEMKIQKCIISGNSFVEVLEYLFGKFRPNEVDFYAEVARHLWFWRNNFVHGGNFLHSNDLILIAKNHVGA